MGKPFVRFCEGMRHNWCMAEIMWHRRETRRQTENTNVMPGALEGLILLDKYLSLSRLNIKCRQNLEIRYYGANVVTSCFLECQKPGELKSR